MKLACRANKMCSRVCGMGPSVAETTRMAPSICRQIGAHERSVAMHMHKKAGLTEDALQHIALVCGPRCAPDMITTGSLHTLSSL